MHLLRNKSQAANVLVVTLVITGLVGFTLANYLTLVQSQNLTVMRSQAWNSTIPVIEAGIQEALAQSADIWPRKKTTTPAMPNRRELTR